jgi:hypothetical protein
VIAAVDDQVNDHEDPALPRGTTTDPTPGQDVVAVGTIRYDPGHGWYEVHR